MALPKPTPPPKTHLFQNPHVYIPKQQLHVNQLSQQNKNTPKPPDLGSPTNGGEPPSSIPPPCRPPLRLQSWMDGADADGDKAVPPASPQEARHRMLQIARNSLSAGRQRLCTTVARGFLQWSQLHQLEPTQESAALFIAARALEPDPPSNTTLAGYAGALKTVFQTSDTPSLPVLARGLRREAADYETVKALPLSEVDQVRVPLAFPEVAVPIWLAIETSSRWDEIYRIERRNFIADLSAHPPVVVVVWKTSKSEQEGTTRPDHTTLLRGPIPNELLQWLEAASPNQRLTSVTTSQLTEKLRVIEPWDPPEPEPGQLLRARYTAHSLKRTGVDRDVVAAAKAESVQKGAGADLLRQAAVRAKHLNVDNTRGYTTKAREWAMAAAGARL